MSFKKGMSAVKESLARSQDRSSGSNTETNWFGWKDGESKILRFLTDNEDVIIVPVHEQVATVTGKDKTFVCREAFKVNCELCGREFGSKDKPLTYKRELGYGVAVLREQAYDTIDGKKVPAKDENGGAVYKDIVLDYETEVDGQKVLKHKPYVGIVSQGLKNFWGQIAVIAERNPLRDQDIEIIRSGKTTDTTYMSIPLGVRVIEKMSKYDKFVPDVESFLNRIGSQEYYDIHLHGIVPEKKKSEAVETFETDDYEEDDNVTLEEETMAQRALRLQEKLQS